MVEIKQNQPCRILLFTFITSSATPGSSQQWIRQWFMNHTDESSRQLVGQVPINCLMRIESSRKLFGKMPMNCPMRIILMTHRGIFLARCQCSTRWESKINHWKETKFKSESRSNEKKVKNWCDEFWFFSFQTNNRCLNVVHIKTVYNKYYYYTLKMNFYWIYGPNRTVRSKFDYAHLLKRPRKSKIRFLRFSCKENGSSLVSLEMIFEAQQSKLFRFEFHTLSSKILKIPEFNLIMVTEVIFRPQHCVRSLTW